MDDVIIRPIGEPGDLGWIVQAHGEQYASEFGWDTTFEALVASIVAEFATEHDPAFERGWIAEVGGRRSGCVLCVRADDATAQLRVLLLDPSARGQGVGGRLVDTCIDFARTAGFSVLKLWTTDKLIDARRTYLSRGFALIDEKPEHRFGVDLIGQVYQLEL